MIFDFATTTTTTTTTTKHPKKFIFDFKEIKMKTHEKIDLKINLQHLKVNHVI